MNKAMKTLLGVAIIGAGLVGTFSASNAAMADTLHSSVGFSFSTTGKVVINNQKPADGQVWVQFHVNCPANLQDTFVDFTLYQGSARGDTAGGVTCNGQEQTGNFVVPGSYTTGPAHGTMTVEGMTGSVSHAVQLGS